MNTVSKAEAAAAGLTNYFTGQPCKNGHVSERRTKSGHCIACVAAAQEAWRGRLGSDGLREKQREYDERFKAKDPARKLANSRAATLRLLARDPDYYRRHAKQWRKDNPEAYAVIAKRCLDKLRAERPEIYKLRNAATGAAYRAKRIGAASPRGLNAALRRIWDQSGGRCTACGSTEHPEIDHIVALSQGGTNAETNFHVLCRSCNRSKGTQDYHAWQASRATDGARNAA
jgi:5-methylcytosine-specific restriction endonuclease McrA